MFFYFFQIIGTEEIFLVFFHFWSIHFLVCKHNNGAVIITLRSISNGLNSSSFCRKMERARPMKENMDKEVVIFPLELEFQSLAVFMMEVLFPI